jgi:hypothetical protein
VLEFLESLFSYGFVVIPRENYCKLKFHILASITETFARTFVRGGLLFFLANLPGDCVYQNAFRHYQYFNCCRLFSSCY